RRKMNDEADNGEPGKASAACGRSDHGESLPPGTIAARIGARQCPDLPRQPRSQGQFRCSGTDLAASKIFACERKIPGTWGGQCLCTAAPLARTGVELGNAAGRDGGEQCPRS